MFSYLGAGELESIRDQDGSKGLGFLSQETRNQISVASQGMALSE
jgi:hypothetical protein